VVASRKTFVTVRLYPGVALAVEVVSVADGRPVPRARGMLVINNTLGDAGRLEAVADERGVVRFPAAALAGYTVARVARLRSAARATPSAATT
jgi:hypothetical protein